MDAEAEPKQALGLAPDDAGPTMRMAEGVECKYFAFLSHVQAET